MFPLFIYILYLLLDRVYLKNFTKKYLDKGN
nr:MAG TPA: hypothetical protein [Caudoviricetes sp.]